jgi:hypothetical protein
MRLCFKQKYNSQACKIGASVKLGAEEAADSGFIPENSKALF